MVRPARSSMPKMWLTRVWNDTISRVAKRCAQENNDSSARGATYRGSACPVPLTGGRAGSGVISSSGRISNGNTAAVGRRDEARLIDEVGRDGFRSRTYRTHRRPRHDGHDLAKYSLGHPKDFLREVCLDKIGRKAQWKDRF